MRDLLPQIQSPNCSSCGLTGLPMVTGKGPLGKLMVIGEAPGEDEIRFDTPFIGYTGKLLRRCLQEAGYDPIKDVYYTNACMCRPPRNRTPEESEISACLGRLKSEIEYVNPTKILLCGSIPSQALLGMSIMKCRGSYYDYKGIPLLPTLHPSYVLRLPGDFRDFASDIEKLHRDPCKFYLPEADGYPSVPYTVLEATDEHICNVLDRQDPRSTIDIETSHVDPHTNRFQSYGFTDRPDHVFIIPVHRISPMVRNAIAAHCARGVNGQNLGYEYQVMKKKYDIEVKPDFDTMLAHYLMDERSGDEESGKGTYHNLKLLGRQEFDAPDWSQAMKPYLADFSTAPKEILYRYQALDISVTHRLRDVFEERLLAEGLEFPLKEVILPAVPLLANMELRGISIDEKYFQTLEEDWQTDCNIETDELRELIEMPSFNVNSPKQVGELLFDKMKLGKVRKNSTDKKVIAKLLQKVKVDDPRRDVLVKIDSLRRMKHILATYIKGIPKEVNEVTGRVHTGFSIPGSDTGRLASRHPNLMNIPARIGSAIRDGFVSTEGYDLGEADYAQLEFRVAALYSLDQAMIEYILSGRDVHSEVACYYFNCEPHEVTKSRRLDAKAVVFGVLYGRGPESLAAEYNLSMKEAERRIDILKQMFPDLFAWIKDFQGTAKNDGYVRSMFGRRRRFPLITKDNQEEIDRQAINTPIQSLASDICLKAAVRIDQRIRDEKLDAHILVLVHDAILPEWREGLTDVIVPIMAEEMRKPIMPNQPIPFDIEVKVGKRWGQLQVIEVPS